MNCHRYEVSATMVGRVDYAGEQMGYGHMNSYKLQFELMSVSEVTAKDLSSRYDPEEFSAEGHSKKEVSGSNPQQRDGEPPHR